MCGPGGKGCESFHKLGECVNYGDRMSFYVYRLGVLF